MHPSGMQKDLWQKEGKEENLIKRRNYGKSNSKHPRHPSTLFNQNKLIRVRRLIAMGGYAVYATNPSGDAAWNDLSA